MHILHLSESDVDNGGARAAYRLHHGLRSIGCHSKMLIQIQFVNDTTIRRQSSLTKISHVWTRLLLKVYPEFRNNNSPLN
jgi:hypothetical protein